MVAHRRGGREAGSAARELKKHIEEFFAGGSGDGFLARKSPLDSLLSKRYNPSAKEFSPETPFPKTLKWLRTSAGVVKGWLARTRTQTLRSLLMTFDFFSSEEEMFRAAL
jgi:hypothetical protein